ncbi:MAG TPA: FAD-dependent oxidoreductase [Desulfobacteria bacterium]|nr:FAD-dependent oxidoreductase [Desulfobacteria bacterium]
MENNTTRSTRDLTRIPESYWITSTPDTSYPALDKDLTADVAIVGGGLVGISTAFLLKQAGVKVVILEADRIGKGTTGHTTAKITSQHSLIYAHIEQYFGHEIAQQYADANQAAIQTVARIVHEQAIDCDFSHRPAYVYTQAEDYIEKIAKEAEIAKQLGIKADYLEETPLPFPIKAALRFAEQAQFHPRKYLLALAKLIPGNGSDIFETTRCVDIEKDDKLPKVITENGHKVSAERIIIATHFPFYDGLGLYFTRIYQERSHVLAIRMRDSFPEGMFISAESPTRSLRSQKYDDGELILVGGEHYKTGQGENIINHYNNLRDFALTTFDVEDILYRWSTQDCQTVDKLPYVGHLTANTVNLYVATGFGKWGMTNSTVSAMLLRDLIVKGESPWQDAYNPSRVTITASAPEFVKQNANVAVNYISGKLAILPVEPEIKVGEGRKIATDGKIAGAYRDEAGKLYLVDTTCTHLGCEVSWNDAEKTWDCPCHGSRFSYKGDVLEGPTHKPLNKIDQAPNDPEPNL